MKTVKDIPEWRYLKDKWDNKIPKQGTPEFKEYQKDVEKAKQAIRDSGITKELSKLLR